MNNEETPRRRKKLGQDTAESEPIAEEQQLELMKDLEVLERLVPVVLSPYRGWPARHANRADTVSIVPLFTAASLTPAKEKEIFENVMDDERVRAFVADGARLLAHDLESPTDDSLEGVLRTRLVFLNDREGVALEVVTVGAEIEDVQDVSDGKYPESIQEVAEAIRLAVDNEEVRDEVLRLEAYEAHAIRLTPREDLQVPMHHRILQVMFTERYDEFTEWPVRLSALVDITARRVLEVRKEASQGE
jgi:hypothetical protein